jgi:hypothetical protein
LAKLSRNYAEMSSRISLKEQECASRVVGDVCWILCSTIKRSVCTLYWNKNVSTFWINGALYYKIKSCTFVGTSYICLLFYFILFYFICIRYYIDHMRTLLLWDTLSTCCRMFWDHMLILQMWPIHGLKTLCNKHPASKFSIPEEQNSQLHTLY